MKAYQREAIKTAKGLGLEVLALEQTGGDHYRLRVKNSFGVVAFFIMANTCSDKRHAQRNNQSLLRRFSEGTFDPRAKH